MPGDDVVVDVGRVRHELLTQGFSVCRQLLSATSVAGATRKLEAAVDRHLTAAVASGEIAAACEGLPMESRIAQAYAACPERAPASWVNQVKGTVAFQHHLFRDESLCALIEALTGRPAVVASRFNCRCKLRDSASANFPWHQDHAFFRMQYLLKKQEPLRLRHASPSPNASSSPSPKPFSNPRPHPSPSPRPDRCASIPSARCARSSATSSSSASGPSSRYVFKYTLPWPNGPNPHAVTRLLFQAFNCLLPVLAPEPDGEGALASFLPSSSS